MNKVIKFITVLALITTLSCERTKTQAIYNDIFNELIESATVDYRNLEIPSPNDALNRKALDSLISLTLNKKKSIYSDRLIIAINDSLFSINNIDKTLKSFSFINLPNINTFKSEKKKIIRVEDLPFDSNRFIIISQNDKIEYVENDLLIKVSLSKIYLNGNIGFLSASFSMGSLNAYGVNILIQKKRENWEIVEIVDSWES